MQTYNDLMVKAGNTGPYQRNLMLLACANYFVAGQIQLGAGLLFLSPKFNCFEHGIDTTNCEQTICELYRANWKDYLEQKTIESISTEFGPFYCGD